MREEIGRPIQIRRRRSHPTMKGFKIGVGNLSQVAPTISADNFHATTMESELDVGSHEHSHGTPWGTL